MDRMQLIFVRMMLENTLDQGEMETVWEMSRRVDDMMLDRIQAAEDAEQAL